MPIYMDNARTSILLVLTGLVLLFAPACQKETTPQVTFTVDNSTITFIPGPGSYLWNSDNVTLKVVLIDVKVEAGVCDQDYSPWLAGTDQPPRIKKGEPCLIVSGTIRNTGKEKSEFLLRAEGYDDKGKWVSVTLDAAYIAGRISVTAEPGENKDFTMHVNINEDLKTIRLYAYNFTGY